LKTKLAMKNAITSLLLQVAVAISGIIVPHFFTAVYGSPVNGMVSSISQFITYMGLVEAGVSAASIVALYKPLAENDTGAINGIIAAAKKFYIRSGLIFAALAAVLVIVYPYVIRGEITDISFIRTMIVILSVNGLVDYFILGKYRVLLVADQKSYVISIAQIAGTIVVTVVSVLLIEMNCSAILVKGTVAVVYVLRSLAVVWYTRKHYPALDLKAEPNEKAISQRWSALLHQVVGMICNNTDIILLTLLLTTGALSEVSVYSIYSLVGFALINIFTALSNGITASFGQVMASGNDEALRKGFSVFEYFSFILIFAAYVCMAALLYPFITLYSTGFPDAAIYTRWGLVALFTACGLLQSIRIPGLTMIVAAGHFKQTQGRAIAEAVINLVVSIVLIWPLGIYGVLIGTCASYAYRSLDVIFYNASRFLKGTLKRTFLRLIRNAATAALLIWLGITFIPTDMGGWIQWVLWALVFAVVSVVVIGLVNILFERDEFREMMKRIKGIIRERRQNG